MNKTREMIPVNIAFFALFVAAMAVALTVNRVQTIDRSVPHFIYEEVRIQKRAPGQIRAKVQSKAGALSKAVSVKRILNGVRKTNSSATWSKPFTMPVLP